MIGVYIRSYCIQLIHRRNTHSHFSSKPDFMFLPVPYFLLQYSPNGNITHFRSFFSSYFFFSWWRWSFSKGKWTFRTIVHTIRLHIIVYYEIIIYRLVEGNIIATLSSRGREKSQFFFSITFRNYHVVLWGSDRFFMILQNKYNVCFSSCFAESSS